jgi:hypothetical protein
LPVSQPSLGAASELRDERTGFINEVDQTAIHASDTPYLTALAPLGPEEITAVVTIIKAVPELAAKTLFQTIELKESTSAEYRAAIADEFPPCLARA